MSKYRTKKGLAFGAGIALVASGLAAVPAQADTTGPVTLVPDAGTTFNSILQSGFTLKTELDGTEFSEEEAASLAFLVENPGAAAISLDLATAGALNEQVNFRSDTDWATTGISPAATKGARLNGEATTAAADDDLWAAATYVSDNAKYAYVTGSSDQTVATYAGAIAAGTAELHKFDEVVATDIDGALLITLTLANGAVLTFTPDGTPTSAKLQAGLRLDGDYDSNYAVVTVGLGAVGADDGNDDLDTFDFTVTYAKIEGNVGLSTLNAFGAAQTIDTNTPGAPDGFNFGTSVKKNTLTIATTETVKNVTLYVTAFLDENGNGVKDTFESASDRETVILYSASAVSAVTTVDSIVVGAKNYKATVVYGNDVNPHMVAADTGVQILLVGTVLALDDADQVGATEIQDGNISLVTRTANLGITKNVITMGPAIADGAAQDLLEDNAVAGIYSAIAVYNTAGDQTFLTADNVRMGAPSAVLDLSAGNNADVDKMALDVTDTANYKETATDANEIYVRAGTTSATFGVQARVGTAVLKAANIDVKAIVTETALDAAAEITISGATGKLVKDGAAITAYGVTDSNGQASFTITSKNGKKNDAIDVAIQFKAASGVWTTINLAAAGGVDTGLDIKWFDTAFSSFTPKPAAYVSGANPVVTFKVTDQWSQPVSFIDDTRLSVYASAYVGGVEDTTKYAERVTVVDGLAAFTFANFAATGGVAELRAVLYKGAETNTATSNVTVYNTADTSAINVATSFKTDITYNDYVTGSSTDTTVAAALVATGLGADTVRATIAGNVNNTAGSGQPGAAVTLSADGVLFYDSAAKVYALNTITTTSNEYGAWTVFAYSHTVNAKGVDVSVTSGTVSASTKLITYFPKDLLTRDNLVFSFDVPATLVMNTTYAVVAKLADKWGNPVQTAGATGSVSVIGNGSAQVNGVTGATVKDFDLKGEATVFIRSLKDIAGPSSVTATLLAVTSQYSIDPAVTGVTGGDATGALGSDSFGTLASTTVDVTGTAWNETTFAKAIAAERDVVTTAPAASADTKVNVGTFKGYVALYAKGYKGQKMTAIVAGKWIKVDSLASDFERVVRYTGAGYSITTKIYIDGVQIGDAFTTMTK